MAVPKKKPSRHRTRQRRSAWKNKHKLPQYTACPECKGKRLPHRACPHCGYYKGEQVIEVKNEKIE